MAAFVTNFVPHLLAGLAERQRRFDQGAPPLLLSAGTLDLDDSPVVRCPYTALTFRAPRCLRCQGTRLILELAHGRELRAAVAGQPTLEQSVQALKAKFVALKAAVPLN